MSHTPGPWRVSSNCVLGSDNAIVATVATYSQVEFTKEEKSNAHLIAAAPELLEACEDIVNEMAIINDNGKRVTAKIEWSYLIAAREAIKKARGE